MIDADFTVVREPRPYKRPRRWHIDWQNFWLITIIGLVGGLGPLALESLERLQKLPPP